ncbi:MAG: ABC transporter ATP-binding protein [Pseudomonadota bacterium]|nr:ABC transporter ATP-binding protein [Pseudomonadota bacterium]
MAGVPLLEIDRVTRTFPGVIANADVSFRVAPGSIHALLGENGAGKSTLVKMIYGVMRPDSGSMRIDGADFAPARPAEARAQGVGMVFQHFSLFDAMTVVENVALALPGARAGQDLADRIRSIGDAYGLNVDPWRRVDALSVGERQRVEIVRCLLQSPRLVIMDEPTSVLTPTEVGRLFEVLRRLRDEGRSILYISHKLAEIRALCDAATVLRGGRVVGSCDPRQESPESLAAMMIGSEISRPERRRRNVGSVRLVLDHLDLPADGPFGTPLRDISLTVHAGEILGLGGIAGNGQTELMEALIGERRAARPDAILLDGKPVGQLGPVQRRSLGMAFVPEERLGHGAAAGLSLTENTLISARGHGGLERRGLLSFLAAGRYAARVIDAFGVATTGPGRLAGSLSGGNLQKFVVGREILQEPGVLVAAQPTWGVDAGAAAEIHAALDRLAEAGAAILIISQDLDELLALSGRFAVIAQGRVSEPQPTESITLEEIGLLMGGIDRRSAA